jgi:hypothetical protein
MGFPSAGCPFPSGAVEGYFPLFWDYSNRWGDFVNGFRKNKSLFIFGKKGGLARFMR